MSAKTWRCRSCGMPAEWPARECVLCQQGGLFADADPNGTEQPSAEEAELTRRQRQVLIGLLRMHARFPKGANAFELQAFLTDRQEDEGIERNAISSRFKELAKKGYVEQSGSRHAPTGKSEQVYVPTSLAFEWRKRTEEAA